MLHLEFNSDSENEGIARIVTAAYIMKFDPDMEEMDDIKTAVSEAVTNCIVHAYHNPDGKISMDLSDQNGILRIEIKDQGIGIPDVKKAMEPMFTTKPEEERTGMGFSFMEAFMDQVEVISKQGEGTTVIMTKKIGDQDKWDPTPVWMHYKDGAMSLEGVRTDKIPADIVKKMEEVKAKIESGEFHPFTGPIKTNDGKEAAKAGEVLKDDQLQTMNYYVDGVIGKVPN